MASFRALLAIAIAAPATVGQDRPVAHWAFVPPVAPAVPDVTEPAVRNPIDAFVLARGRAAGLTPAPEADRPTLCRRLALDLTGLPPTPAELDAFVTDPRPDAYEQLVDRLLASPRFGEHMALPWLDAARYADSNGYQNDGDRQAWPWRDWLIDALDRNRPLDELVVEMLAGDLLPDATDAQRIATAFNRNHPINDEGGALADEVRFNYVVDRVHTTATTFLGLTFACAQCHDHKYDPISQRDYYRFFAFFDNVDEDGRVDVRRPNSYHVFHIEAPYVDRSSPEDRAALAQAEALAKERNTAYDAVRPAIEAAEVAWLRGVDDAALAALPPRIASAVLKYRGTPLTGAERALVRDHFVHHVATEPSWPALQDALDAARRAVAELHERMPLVMVMAERAERRPTQLHRRGAYDQPFGDVLEPAIPAALGALPADGPRDRLALARWIVAPSNPLFARVAVNRLWQGVFGRGLVATPEDFGTTGSPPTHPELLDWLAVDFVTHGYDTKRLLRTIVTSATYRRTSHATPDALAIDPEDRWLMRSPRARLSSFALRDQALAIAGLLDERRFGPPVYPYHPDGLWRDVSFEVFAYPHGRVADRYRRTIYTFWRRTVAPPALFDAANRQTCVVRAMRTNTPLHALVLLNEPTFGDAAAAFAARFADLPDASARVTAMWRAATGRVPEPAERALSLEVAQRDGYAALGLLILNLDEVLCRP